MQWNEYPYCWKAYTRLLGVTGKSDAVVKALTNILRRGIKNTVAATNTSCQLACEVRWTKASRPYYNVYPTIPEAFTKIDLAAVNGKHIKLPLSDLLLRFQVGHEFAASEKTKVRTILVSQTTARTGGQGLLLAIDDGSTIGEAGVIMPIPIVRGMVLLDDLSVEELLERGRKNRESETVDEPAVDNVMRLVVALCLLKSNPDLIEPEPLTADRERWEQSHDPALIVKAEKKGHRCWSIGKRIEVTPGFRRPHFAIRWCGKGGIDPQLRPIKGCLVNRRAVEEVPTGYLDAEAVG